MTTIRVVDVETSGLAPKPAAVVEIAYVDLNQDADGKWVRGATWSSLVNPGAPIDVEAMAVHHITDAMVARAPPLDQVLPLLSDTAPISGQRVTLFAAHHAAFEADFVKIPDARWLCTYKNAVTLWQDAPSYKNQVLRYWLGLSLADAAMAQPHRALGDAYVTAALLRRQLGEGLTVDDMLEVAAGPVVLPRFFFGEHAGKPIAEIPSGYLDWIVNKSRGPWDSDVYHTAKWHLEQRHAAARGRSPVDAGAVAAAQTQAER